MEYQEWQFKHGQSNPTFYVSMKERDLWLGKKPVSKGNFLNRFAWNESLNIKQDEIFLLICLSVLLHLVPKLKKR